MKKLFLIISLSLASSNYGDFEDFYTLQQAANKKLYNKTEFGGTGNGQTTSSCPQTDCSQCSDSTTSAMQAITVQVQDISGYTLASQTFQNSNFKHNNGLLSVHIFPPSNGVSTQPDFYYIVYTLKSLNGSTLRKYVQQVAANTITALPASVSVLSGTTSVATAKFLPSSISTMTQIQQQQIFNALCPQSQKFLLTQNGTSVNATILSGMFENSSSDSITLPSATATKGSAIQQIAVQINSKAANTLTFAATSFNQTDLINGLSLTINIFPPSTAAANGNYFIVGTLKTLDGLKLRKQILPNTASFNNLPSSVSISYGGTAVLTSIFFDTTSTSMTTFNMISPLSLKYLIQNQGGNINISIL